MAALALMVLEVPKVVKLVQVVAPQAEGLQSVAKQGPGAL